MSKLISTYRSILNYFGYEADDKGFVYEKRLTKDSQPKPVTSGGKRMILPMQELLASREIADYTVFNPLRENAMKGESDLLRTLRYNINVKLGYSINVILLNLLKIASSVSQHENLTPDQKEFMIGLPEVDSTSITNFVSVMKRISTEEKGDSFFVSIYLKRGGVVKGEKYSRAGIVWFPYYEELTSKEKSKDKDLRVKDIKIYAGLLKYLFPKIDEEDGYNYGSNSDVAPFFDSLMMASSGIAARINDVAELFKDYIDDYKEIMYSTDWYDDFMDLRSLWTEARRIPDQTPLASTQEPQPPVTQTPSQPQAPQPQVQAQPTAYQPQQQQQLVRTANGLDFDSVVRANPQRFGVYQQNPQYNQQTQYISRENRVPYWARGKVDYSNSLQQQQQPMFYNGYNLQNPGMINNNNTSGGV